MKKLLGFCLLGLFIFNLSSTPVEARSPVATESEGLPFEGENL